MEICSHNYHNCYVKLEKLRYVITAYNMPEYGFSLTRISRVKTESSIIFLYGNIRVRKNPYPGILYAVHIRKNMGNVMLKYWKIANPVMLDGNKRTYILKQTCRHFLQDCLSMYGLLSPPGRNGLTMFLLETFY